MIFYVLTIVVAMYITWMDICHRRIPNNAIVLLLFIGFCYFLSFPDSAQLAKGGLLIPFLSLLAGIALSLKKIIGMGDIKLLFVTLLLCPEEWQVDIIYFILLIGGIWSLLWHFVLRKIALVAKFDTVKEGVPYGIPIAVALCIFTFIA
ncbi:hypothetical protein GWD52_20035 [Enterobacteriaceae bacterium 4M9]|nr:hypothetical protein [Enterobacteriaceae bacterium 4M9]